MLTYSEKEKKNLQAYNIWMMRHIMSLHVHPSCVFGKLAQNIGMTGGEQGKAIIDRSEQLFDLTTLPG